MQQGIGRRFVNHWHTNTETAVLSINKYYTPDDFEKYWAALSGYWSRLLSAL